MSSIGDLYLRILADATGLGVDIERKAGPEVDKAGKTLGQRMGASLKKNAGTAIAGGFGAVLGAGFAIASKGAVELDAATQRLIADTGLTGEAAEEAKGQIASLYRDNLQGFAEIGDALGKVHTDLGLTGAVAGETAEKFLKFATATGQNAGEAVSRLDDIMDNWNLTADHAQEIMDKLIVSHDRYGGSIADNERTLGKLAPAMQAANFQIDDGIALLGLFGAKGLDSERAAAAFSKALTKVKSPAELKALIADIQATEDPFARAQKAADLFGAKAGAQLANALGGANLDDFIVSMEESAGATEKAADAVQSGFGAQFELALKNAGGALAEFGDNFGPLLLVAGQFGPKFAASLGAGLGTLASLLPKVLGPKLLKAIIPTMLVTGTEAGVAAAAAEVTAQAEGVAAGQAVVAAEAAVPATAAGGTIGTTMGLAAGAALAAAFAAAAIVAVKAVQDQVAEGIKAVGPSVGDFADKTLDELLKMKADIQDKLKSAEVFGPLADLSGFNPVLKQALAGIDEEITSRTPAIGEAAAEGFGEGIKDGTPAVTTASKEMVDAAMAKAQEIRDRAHKLGGGFAQEYADGIKDRRSTVDAATQALTDAIEHRLNVTAETSRLIGLLTGKQLADGLHDSDPRVRAQAQASKQVYLDELEKLKPSAKTLGAAANDLLVAGLKSKNPNVVTESKATRDLMAKYLAPTAAPKTAGEDTGSQFGGGLDASRDDVTKSADAVATAGVPRPTAEDRQHAYEHGQGLGERFVAGLGSTEKNAGKAADDLVTAGTPGAPPPHKPPVSSPPPRTSPPPPTNPRANRLASGGPAPANVPVWVGERGRELIVPQVHSTVIPHVQSERMAAGGGDTFNIPLTVVAAPEVVRRPADVANELRIGSRLGWYKSPRLVKATG